MIDILFLTGDDTGGGSLPTRPELTRVISGGRCGGGGGGGSRVGRGGDGTSVGGFTSEEPRVGPSVVGGTGMLSAGLETLVSLATIVVGRGGNG